MFNEHLKNVILYVKWKIQLKGLKQEACIDIILKNDARMNPNSSDTTLFNRVRPNSRDVTLQSEQFIYFTLQKHRWDHTREYEESLYGEKVRIIDNRKGNVFKDLKWFSKPETLGPLSSITHLNYSLQCWDSGQNLSKVCKRYKNSEDKWSKCSIDVCRSNRICKIPRLYQTCREGFGFEDFLIMNLPWKLQGTPIMQSLSGSE